MARKETTDNVPLLDAEDSQPLLSVEPDTNSIAIEMKELTTETSTNTSKADGEIRNTDVRLAPVDQKLAPKTPQSCVQKFKAAWNPVANLKDAFVPKTSEQQLSFLDGIRGFAMMWVMCTHSWIFLSWNHSGEPGYNALETSLAMRMIKNGELSVDMFFVLSGFLISHVLIREHERTGRISIPRFFLRRWLRIFPTYAFILALYWPSLNMLGKYVDCPACNACNERGWMNLLFINNFASMYNACMGWTWSVAIEVQYYIFSPFLLWLWLKKRKAGFVVLAILMALSTTVRAVLVWYYDIIHSGTATYLDNLYVKPYTRVGPYLLGLLLGCLWALWRKYRKDYRPTRLHSILWLIGEVVVLVTMILIIVLGKGNPSLSESDFWHFIYVWVHRDVWGLCAMFLIFSSLVANELTTHYKDTRKPLFLYPINVYRWCMSWRLWYTTAHLSYSAYLLHPIWITVFYVQLGIQNVTITFWWYLLLCIVNIIVSNIAAIVTYLIIEKPLMNLRY